MVKRNYYNEDKDLLINDYTAIKNYKFSDDQIYEKEKYGGKEDYRKFEGEIYSIDQKTGLYDKSGGKVTGYVSLKDDNVRDLERIK